MLHCSAPTKRQKGAVRVLVRRVMKWVVSGGGGGAAITAGDRHSCTPRARDLPFGEHSRFAYRRCAPAPWSAALSRGGAGAYGKRYRPFGTTLFTLQHSSMSGAVKSRQVTVKSPSPSTLTSTALASSTSTFDIGFLSSCNRRCLLFMEVDCLISSLISKAVSHRRPLQIPPPHFRGSHQSVG